MGFLEDPAPAPQSLNRRVGVGADFGLEGLNNFAKAALHSLHRVAHGPQDRPDLTAVSVLKGRHGQQKQFPRSQHQRQIFSEGARGGGSPEDDSLDARRGKLLLSMSPLEDADGRKVGAVLRAVGDTVERVKRCLCKIVEPLEAKIGSNPYAAVKTLGGGGGILQ